MEIRSARWIFAVASALATLASAEGPRIQGGPVGKASALHTPRVKSSPWEREIVYQIFPRSFFDSTGDCIGDLPGVEQKLDYLQRLGVTAILLNPIFASRLYHNYFADDFMTVDPNFGTNEEFFHLVRQAHRRHIKVILDMEVQYVADRHPWFVAVQKDPKSRFAEYLWPNGSAYREAHGYNGVNVSLCAVNPDSPAVRDYMRGVFRFWTDPKGDKASGVDGFRIDHMMDDLDNKHVKTGMLKNFWLPIERDVWKIKPTAFFLGEQSDWGLGADLFSGADVSAAFAIPLRFALLTLDKAKIESAIQALAGATPPGKTQVLFIENHDVNRFATEENGDPGILRLGAVLNLTLKGTPAIYYGQELGMRGKKINGHTDGNDIPLRLAYRWSAVRDAPGTSIWYRNTGPWWSDQYSADHDGISLAEEDPLPDSLFNFYRRMIEIRRRDAALSEGSQTLRIADNPHILAFERESGSHRVLVAVNLSNAPQTWTLGAKDRPPARDLWTDKHESSRTISLAPYGFKLLELR